MGKDAPLRIAIIGCGRVAQMRHLPLLQSMKTVRVVALADSDPEKLSSVARQYKVSRRFDNHLALLDDDAIDAVLVCTPPACHFEHAKDVLQSGRHLYVDSPLALSPQHCQSLVELGERSQCTATVGLNLRYHALIQRARICIQAGLVGPVHAITATFSTPSRGKRGDRLPAWRQPQTIDGNVFGESAVQHFDAWRALTAAEFTEIFVQRAEIGGPVSVAAQMQHSETNRGGAIVVAAVFSEYAGDNSEIRLIGREGTIALSLYRYDGFSFCPALETPGSIRRHLRAVRENLRSLPQGFRNLIYGGEYGITFKRQIEAFVVACKGGNPPPVSLADGKAATLASLAAFQSMMMAQKVEI